MRVLATFYTVREAMAYIERNGLDDAFVQQDFFSRRYEVVQP